MQITPAYDVERSEWYAELEGGSEISAKTLCTLQEMLPGYELVGYYPNGFVAERDGFLKESLRKPMVVMKRGVNLLVDRKRQQPINDIDDALGTADGLPSEGAPVDLYMTKSTTYDDVLNLVADGLTTLQISRILTLRVGTVQTQRMKGLRANDPRAFAPRRTRVRVVRYLAEKYGPWTQEDDRELAELCAEGWSSRQIAGRTKRSRNAIIGRARRKGIPFARSTGITARGANGQCISGFA